MVAYSRLGECGEDQLPVPTTAGIQKRHNTEAHGLFPESSMNALYQLAYIDRDVLLNRLELAEANLDSVELTLSDVLQRAKKAEAALNEISEITRHHGAGYDQCKCSLCKIHEIAKRSKSWQ